MRAAGHDPKLSSNGDGLAITVGVAVTRPEQYRVLMSSLAGQPHADDHVLIALDGVETAEPTHVTTADGQSLKVRYLCHETPRGLSHCRNQVLELAPTRFVVFLDDDTEVTPGLLARYRQRFAEGQQVVGGPLCLPGSYPWPSWLPRTYGSLLGIHHAERKIWGGNFGFDRLFALRHGICFEPSLGRCGKRLWSGDDTTFVKEMETHQARVVFDPEIVVYHHIATSRFGLPYLLRRAYWQGRSEVLRRSIRTGLRKEFRRAFGCAVPGTARSLSCLAAGALLFASVVCGVTVQLAVGIPAARGVPAPDCSFPP